MGLLSHIEEANYRKDVLASSITFKDFHDKYAISSFGFFSKKDGYYILNKSFGIDVKTIVNLKIESIFFDELLIFDKKAYSYKKTDFTIKKLTECFSLDFKDCGANIYLYRVKDFVLMILSKNEIIDNFNIESIFSDLTAFIKSNCIPVNNDTSDLDEKYFKYKFCFNSAIKNTLLNYNNGNDFSDCLYNQVVLNLLLFFPTPSYIKELPDYVVELYIKAKERISEGLLKIQIQNNFKDLFKNNINDIELI